MNKFGPYRMVCFGGGTGLPTLLRGLRQNNYWINITAIVVMFDAGGRSKKLRDKHGTLPPSDIARCLLALSPEEALLRKILFDDFEGDDTALHLLLTWGEKIEDFETPLRICRKLLKIKKENHLAIPVTISKSHLCALAESGITAENEVEVDALIKEGEIIKNLFLKPSAIATNKVLQAIQRADVICIGPGSFYTSLLPNFLVKGVREAIIRSKAPIIFISNLLKEGLGMQNLSLEDIVKTAEEYAGRKFAKIIVNESVPLEFDQQKYQTEEQKTPILFRDLTCADSRFEYASLWKNPEQAHHDSSILDKVVYSLTRELLN